MSDFLYTKLHNAPRPHGETREKILSFADRLIRVMGYNAFSYKHISALLCVQNAAVHYHFPTKEDLGIEVVDREIQSFRQLRQRWEQLEFPEDLQLTQLIEKFAQYREAGSTCMMGSLAPDYERMPKRLKEKVQEMAEDRLNWLTSIMETGRRRGLFHFEEDAHARALVIMTELSGSLLFNRVFGNEAFDTIRINILNNLK